MSAPVNERQLEVLKWIAKGCPTGTWPEGDFSHRISAAALKSRGLVTIKGHGPTWMATMTESGAYYLEHSAYRPGAKPQLTSRSAQPRAATAPAGLNHGKAASETLGQAKKLIKRIQKEGKITVVDPEGSTRAHYRRLLHACRVHHLVPEGNDLLFTGRSSGDIVIKLSNGSSSEASDWNRIRTTARKITTNLDALHKALETSSILDPISEELRPRSFEVLLELAGQLREQGLKLGINVKLKTPKVFIQVDTRKRNLSLTEITDQVPHVPTASEKRTLKAAPWTQVPKFDQVPSGRLRIRVERDGSYTVPMDHQGGLQYERNADEWSDERRKPLERQVRYIARAIKKGVVDDDDALRREEQRRAEAHAEYLRNQEAERQKWKEIRSRAREKALIELREATFARAFEAWQGAQELRLFADQLEAAAIAQETLDHRPRLNQWLEWARARADEIDPVTNLENLDDSVFDAEPSANDLRPHMEGWDPSAPHQDYSAAYRRTKQQPSYVPQPRLWHPGMRGKPSWWRH
ncbi:hypothetical protein [Propionibacterium freudenreichii]|uniref:hypothetical protein n=1 Tax=Propionibacterium freudenreichii TaxID=1744 RepID=UPI0005A5CFF3|nr:hypothetical protein [Propionibacterium freudenreichii]CEI30606.1 Protein of unknown function [Propionibacterium freudenreichii]